MRMLSKVQHFVKRFISFFERQDVYVILLIVLVGSASFGIGRLSVQPEEETSRVRIEDAFSSKNVQMLDTIPTVQVVPIDATEREEPTSALTQGAYVGSKNSDKYHYPWCPGAQRIKEENKVWFASRDDAENAGYTPAGNCKGL